MSSESDSKSSRSGIRSGYYDDVGHMSKAARSMQPDSESPLGSASVSEHPPSATKRREQNRAAQRAFRERKEKHLKDLENRVHELEQESHMWQSNNVALQQRVRTLEGVIQSFNESKRKRESPPDFKHNPSTPDSGPPSVSGTGSCPHVECPPALVADNLEGPRTNGYSYAPPDPAPAPSALDEINRNMYDKDTFCSGLALACANPNVDSARPGYPSFVQEHLEPVGPLMMGHGGHLGAGPAQTPSKAPAPPVMPAPIPPVKTESDMHFSFEYRDVHTDSGVQPLELPELISSEYAVFEPLEDLLAWPLPNEYGAAGGPPTDCGSSASGYSGDTGSLSSSRRESVYKTKIAAEDAVPAGGKLVSCSEVWDRLTSHPRFGEIDIAGMCQELRTKARCSDSGVVLKERDVEGIFGQLSSKAN